jgi:F-box and leucine-rich repeat protein GRR1
MKASNLPTEFTEHQRNLFCVFSGQGVTGLRNHLNRLETTSGYGDPMITGADDDDDQTMTGMVGATAMMGMGTAALNADDEDADGDEELEDGDGAGDGGVSFGRT